MPVSEVTSADVLEILTPIWHRKADTARRVRLRLRAVLEWAIAMEYRIGKHHLAPPGCRSPEGRCRTVLQNNHNVIT